MTTVVILSGGQDSTTCLVWAIEQCGKKNLRAVTFSYSQRHSKEIIAAAYIAKKLQVDHLVFPIPLLWSTSPLISANSLDQYGEPSELPGGVERTFIPCRNILFLTLAANYGLVSEQTDPREVDLVIGVSEADYGGYPDCREAFIDYMCDTLNQGIFGHFGRRSTGGELIRILTPLINKTKKDIVLLAKELGCLDLMADTWTCYAGEKVPCRKCHACMIRERGFLDAGIPDPLIVRLGLPWPPAWS